MAATPYPVATSLAATQYHYDNLGRLVLVANDDDSTIVYTHDANGNVLSITSGELAMASFNPTSGYVGDSITILGTGFHPEEVENDLVIGGVAAIVTSASPTTLVAPIPVGATTCPISVTVAGNSAQSTQSLVVIPPPTPPAQMKWLMGFEGLDGGTPNDDESSSNRTVTVGGNAQIDSGVALIGASSLLLDGVGDYVRVADDAVFEANGPFVAEATIRPNDSGRIQVIFGKRNAGAQHGWTFNINASNQLQAAAWGSGDPTPVLNISSTATLTSGTTYKVAVERTSGGVWTIFLNGAIAAQGTETAAPTGNSEPLYLGRDHTTTAYTPASGAFPR